MGMAFTRRTCLLHYPRGAIVSLFQFGFSRVVEQRSEAEAGGSGSFVPDHLPSVSESGLGMVEYREEARAVSELSDPQPAKKGNPQGMYTQNSVQI